MAKRCPICGVVPSAVAGDGARGGAAGSTPPWAPFCSARCKDIDLGRWLGEEYRISRPMTASEVASALTRPEDDAELEDLEH